MIWESPSFTDSPTLLSNKGKKDAGYPRKKYSFLAFNLDNRVENAPDIDAAAKMGHISSKSAGAAESQTDSFEESPYLGPSGLHLGLQNPSISVSQGLCQLQVKLSTKDWNIICINLFLPILCQSSLIKLNCCSAVSLVLFA